MWHLLQLSDTLDAEFSSALTERVPVTAWQPVRTWFPWLRSTREAAHELREPPVQVRRFPLLHGFSRWPVSLIAGTGGTITKHLLAHTPDPATSPLICTVPFFAAVAERWPGPVAYWLTDRIERYNGVNAQRVHALDKRMCAAATLVCPNSVRLADYLREEGACSSAKIRIVPNATRAANVLMEPPLRPGPLPRDVRDLRRPVIGIIGNLASNMDWPLLVQMVRQTPDFDWLFVGPADEPMRDATHRDARSDVMQQSNTRFIGRKPYGELAAYARAFDVAMLPYRRCEPTYSGSSTRFYEHLAAGRPMLGVAGIEELLRKEPWLTLFNSAEEGVRLLRRLQGCNFEDGLAASRWQESLACTWQTRAAYMIEELSQATGTDLLHVPPLAA